ncbi:hypothetical protein [Paucisalibacillus globulus]|uniref:hypothetical protein n=1 Tax=Paucisalibacillus globulus TaxID=351095 RepID=UPI000409A630|nr:hypothetical protein [Paucisalibacillus globulus]
MKIRFFERNEFLIKKAIGPGIYNIKIGLSGENKVEYKSLYIGQSYSMMTRCSTHLYELHKNPSYFGLKGDDLSIDNLELIVEIYELIDEVEGLSSGDRNILLRKKELEAIKKLKPLSQLETSDRLNPKRADIVRDYLDELLKRNV